MNKDETLNQQIKKLVSAEDPQEVKQIYRQWASSYEQDLEDYGYVAPAQACELFSALLENRQALIYDAGCGTGLVGKLLQARGYTRIHGADFSPDMLQQAAQSGAYESLMPADFSSRIDVADAIYDAVISVGVYTARFGGSFIPQMLRILKPGSLLLFTCRELYFDKEVRAELSALVDSGEISEPDVSLRPYLLGQGANAYFITLHKTG